MEKQQIGVIGLASLGKDLALNIECRGYTVSVYSHSTNKTKEFINNEAKGKSVVGTFSIREFVHSLKEPRNILVMVKKGKPTNLIINSLKPFLQKGDIVIDGGLTFFQDAFPLNK